MERTASDGGAAATDAYRTLTLHIFDDADEPGPDGVAPHRATLSVEDGETELGVVNLDPEAADRVLREAAAGRLSIEAARAYGSGVFEAVFRGELLELYRRARRQGRLAYRIVVEPRAWRRIPFELMFDPAEDREVFLSRDGPMVRDLNLEPPGERTLNRLPLRVLVAASSPEGVARLDVDREVDGIAAALADPRIEVEPLKHASPAEIQRRLSLADPPFDVLHLIGHGERSDGGTGLRLDGDYSEGVLVGPTEFRNAVSNTGLRLVVLNSCGSLEVAANEATSYEATSDFAEALLGQADVPALIGMQASVADDVAADFAADFYEALAANRPIDEAFTMARRRVRVDDVDGGGEFAIPVCYLRNRDAAVIDIRPPDAEEPELPWWRRIGKGTAQAIGLVAGLIAIVTFVIQIWPDPPSPMSAAAFNIAVAEFSAFDGEGRRVPSDDATDLSLEVFELLENEINQLSTEIPVEIRGPEDTGGIEGTTREERAGDALDLAERINADVILYGSVVDTPDGKVFQPEFQVRDRWLEGATELVGQYDLGDPIPFGTLASIQQTRESMTRRGRALARFVFGLSFYAIRDFDRALEQFGRAADIAGWDEQEGREILHLLLANTHARLGDFAAATREYEEAFRIQPEYGRARLGLGTMTFQQARGTEACAPGTVDVAGLDEAVAQFRSAVDAEIQPVLADVPAKADFGIGTAAVCQAFAGVDLAADPEEAFGRVIGAAEEAEGRLDELAAESHANLGLYFLTPTARDPARAIEEYRLAIAGEVDDERRALFFSMIAAAHEGTGDVAAALEAMEQAAELAGTEATRTRYDAEVERLQGLTGAE